MRYVLVICAGLAAATPGLTHHSNAALDMTSRVTVEGTVTEFYWRNPHIYFVVQTVDAQGRTVDWELQTGSTITSSRMGWTRDSLAVGDRVTLEAHPALDGRPYGVLAAISKEGGIVLPTSFDGRTAEPALAEPEVTVGSDSLNGIWMARNSELVTYPGGFDGFFHANLVLTEAGQAAQATFNELSTDNPEARCIGRPAPAMIISSNIFPMHIEIAEDEEIIYIRSQFWDEERTVYMDGREHPGADVRFPSGHSIGRWEDDTLIVDTTNFSDHRTPYQIGVPSGGRKHVVESYRLIEGGTRLQVEFTLEDPDYIAEPLTHSRQLVYVPDMVIEPYDCDEEAASRFVPQ